MKHLIAESSSLHLDKILANWQTAASFIYDKEVFIDDLKMLLRHEVLNKNRPMIITRIKTRLLNLMKNGISNELEWDIKELKRIRESDRELSTEAD